MNNFYSKKIISLALARTKAISKELKKEFSRFISNSESLEKQAVYLLDVKQISIAQVVEDLFHIPIKKQSDWGKEKEENKDTLSLEIKKSYLNFQTRTDFKDWKQENGFDSIPLEIGDIHTVINFHETKSPDYESYFEWSFSRARYGIRGWGNMKLVKDIQNGLLDNNSNPGWVVQNFLQDNKFLLTSEFKLHSAEEKLSNPLIISSRDSHSLLFMLLGHPFLFFNKQQTPVTNSLETVQYFLNIYTIDEHYLALACFRKEDTTCFFIPTEEEGKNYTLLFGSPKGLLYNNKYYRIHDNSIQNYMMQQSFSGVLIPKNDWKQFEEKLQLHYPDTQYEFTSSPLPFVIPTRHMHNWQYWLKPSEVLYNKENKLPIKISLNEESCHLNTNRILLNYTNEEQLKDIVLPFKSTPKTHRLFKILQILQQTNNLHTIEYHTISQIAPLTRSYPFAYGLNNKPLVSEKAFYFRINLSTGETPDTHLLQGELGTFNSADKFIPLPKPAYAKIQILGGTPSFILYKGQLHRIHHMISASFITATLHGVTINTHEISDFYSTVLPFLKQRGISLFDPNGMLYISSLFHYKIQARMTIREIEGMLIGNMSTILITESGNFPYPFKNSFNEFEITLQQKKYQIPRDSRQEKKIEEALQESGWVEESDGSYSMRQEQALKFVLNHLPKQTADDLIIYYGEKNLKRWKAKTHTPSMALNIKTNIDWFDVDLKINIDEQQVAIKKIIDLWQNRRQAIDNGDKGIIIIDKKWLDKYSPILNRLTQQNLETESDSSILKTEKYNLSLICELEEAAEEKTSDNQWKKIIKKLSDTKSLTTYEIPKTVKATLRDYQKGGVNWLCLLYDLGFGGILADDMGLGKTLQTLTFLAIIKENKKSASRYPNLVIAPTSVVTNWQAEAKKFTPHFKTILLHGQNRQSYYDEVKQADLIITTYSLLQRDLEWLSSITFNVIILDEAQNIKNAQTKTTQAVMKLKTKHRLTLTGTPIENSVMELWSQFQFLMPGFFGSLKEFKQNYIQPSKKIVNQTLLHNQIRPFILRRLKLDVATELPPKTQQILYCEMGKEQKELYDLTFAAIQQQIKQKLPLSNSSLSGSQFMIFDSLLKLRQICCDPRLSTLSGDNPPESAKFQLFMETLINVVNEGHRVLVFSQFVKMLDLMHEPLQNENIPFLQLDGNLKNRAEVVNKFQESDTYPVFLISLKAGGTGINLTAADYVFHYDPWWNPAIEEQATDRAYRIGQKNQLIVYKLITRNSIEEKILLLQEKKQSIARHIVKPTDSLESILNLEDIKNIFSL